MASVASQCGLTSASLLPKRAKDQRRLSGEYGRMLPYSAHCRAYGVSFRLYSNSAWVLGLAIEASPHGSEQEDGFGCVSPGDLVEFALIEEKQRYRLLRNGLLISEQKNLRRMLRRLGRHLMVHVANFAPGLVFLHAGVVSWQGRALVLPGPSFAGKTTLVSELVRAGATYYSDEYAVVGESGLIHPYARDLQWRRPGWITQTALPVTKLGGQRGTIAIVAARIAFCQYVEGAEWSPQAISAGTAVLELLRHAIPVQRTPARVMAVLTAMVGGTTAIRSSRGDAADTAQKLLALCDTPSGEA